MSALKVTSSSVVKINSLVCEPHSREQDYGF